MSRPNFNWKLPAAIEARLGKASYGAQRAIHEDDHLLLVLHEPPAPREPERTSAVFLRQPAGKWLYQGADNGEFALRQLLDRYRQRLAELDQHHAKAVTADDLFRILDLAMPLARAAANLRDALQSAREAVKADAVLIDLRDEAVGLARGLELLLADARLALDYRLARQAEEQVLAAQAVSRAQHKLNILAALTLPLMTLAALFGMNLPSGLESGRAPLFWALAASGLGLGLASRAWVKAGAVVTKTTPGKSLPQTKRKR